MTGLEIVMMLDDMRSRVETSFGISGDTLYKSDMLQLIEEKKTFVVEAEKKEQERLQALFERAASEAECAKPIPIRMCTKLEDLEPGDRVKVCGLECQPMTIIGFSNDGNVKCILGDGGKVFHIPPSMLVKV